MLWKECTVILKVSAEEKVLITIESQCEDVVGFSYIRASCFLFKGTSEPAHLIVPFINLFRALLQTVGTLLQNSSE